VSKLTLSIDKSVVARAKRYAKQRGVSVSQMVETYLAMVAEPAKAVDLPPILRSVRGTLKKADLEDHRRHLTRKYR
jgi:antitoxin component of RelBE/YafQ-DinJ toxin-antitoxin module